MRPVIASGTCRSATGQFFPLSSLVIVPDIFANVNSFHFPSVSKVANENWKTTSLRASSPGRSGGGAGKKKENLQLRLWNLNICIAKVDAKCWLAEMTLVMTSLPSALDFRCLFTFALVSPSRWLAEIWQLSRRGATGELEVEFKFRKRSCKLSFLFPPRRQSARESLLSGQVACFQLLTFWQSMES